MFKRKAVAIYAFLSRLYFYEDTKLAEIEGMLNLKLLHKQFYKYYQLGFAHPYKKVRLTVIHWLFKA